MGDVDPTGWQQHVIERTTEQASLIVRLVRWIVLGAVSGATSVVNARNMYPVKATYREEVERLFKQLGEMGVLGIMVGEEFGGANMDALAVAVAERCLASSPDLPVHFVDLRQRPPGRDPQALLADERLNAHWKGLLASLARFIVPGLP